MSERMGIVEALTLARDKPGTRVRPVRSECGPWLCDMAVLVDEHGDLIFEVFFKGEWVRVRKDCGLNTIAEITCEWEVVDG